MSVKKYVAYYRVSTSRQGDSGLGLEAQKAVIRNFTKNGKVVDSFTDIASGKSRENRPNLAQAIAMAKLKNAILIVAKLDRVARCTLDGLDIVRELGGEDNFLACDLPVLSGDMPRADNFTITLFFACAERERMLISLRTKGALEAKKKLAGGQVINGAPLHKTDTRAKLVENMRKAREASQQKAKERNLAAYREIMIFRKRGYKYAEIVDIFKDLGRKTPRGCDFSVKKISLIIKMFKEPIQNGIAQAYHL